ncbi:MAG: IS1634 family transposase [Desulfitobacteriaceae bacterium]
MELGAIFEDIQQLPKQAQTALLRELKLTDARHMPAGAVLVAMQLLTALGVLRQIDLVLGEEHTSIEYLKQEMAAGRKQVPSSGILIGLLVADILAYPKRIARVYEVQTLAKAWHTDKLLGIDPDLLNDDRLLRSLSKLGVQPSAMRDILQGTTLDVSDQFKIGLSRFFVDGSILQLDGVFAKACKVCPGRGKDSLSQLVTSLVAASGSRLPVSFDVLPGGTNDSTTLPKALAAMDRVAPPGPIEWIADRIFPTAKNILFLQNQKQREYRFIAPLKTGISEKRFRELVDQAWDQDQWEDINYRNAEEIRKKRERSYQAYETEWTLTETEKPKLPPGQTRRSKGSIIRHEVTVRCVVYRHGYKAKQELQNRDKQRVDCEAALEEFLQKLNKRNLQTLKDCEQAGERLLKDFAKVKPFVNLAFSENAHKAVLLTWTWDEDAYVRQKRYDGVFSFLTNHSREEVSANEILCRYRDRNQIEMNFRDLKGLLDLERIFMQIPERIDAYLFIKVLAYFVLAFLRWFAQENGYGKMTESKIQDQLSELGISRISIEPLGIDKWSVANDNPLTIFFRSSLGLPDPHVAINILNALTDVKRQITLWLQAWEQTQRVDGIANQNESS